jgi:hypothetical protein
MPDEQGWTREDVGSWVGVLLCIILLESHAVSRPLVFLIAPFVVLLCLLVIAFPIRGKRLQRVSIAATAVSVAGFLLARYVLR